MCEVKRSRVVIEEEQEGARQYFAEMFQAGVFLRDDQSGEVTYIDKSAPPTGLRVTRQVAGDLHAHWSRLITMLEEAFPDLRR